MGSSTTGVVLLFAVFRGCAFALSSYSLCIIMYVLPLLPGIDMESRRSVCFFGGRHVGGGSH